jgi:dTDP-4-amino-4,6-dideoxygalactose transaminase
LRCTKSTADRAETALAQAGIESGRWWSQGAHAHPATLAYPRTAVPATEALAQSMLGVPFYRDLGAAAIEKIGRVVLAAAQDRVRAAGV